MAEEWQLSAHDTAKRILLQQCTREAAGMVGENKSSRIYIYGQEGIGQSLQLLFLVESWDTLFYTCLMAMTCDDMHLLLGQASFIKVFMICPINNKKFSLIYFYVTKTTWKDILVQQQPLL